MGHTTEEEEEEEEEEKTSVPSRSSPVL